MKKRLCSLLLALLMVVTVLPATAAAAETASGTCGENLTWTLDDSGTLTISGEGKMWNFWGDSPWKDQRESIKRVVIEDGVTNIGSSAFSGCTGLTSVTLPDSVTSIGSSAFEDCTGLTSVTIPDSVKTIRGKAFAGCTNLTTVTIPKSVFDIAKDSFSGCSNLKDIFYGSTRIMWDILNVSVTKSVTIHCAETGDSITVSGNCGYYDEDGDYSDDLTWVLDDGVLTVSGEGGMPSLADGDYDNDGMWICQPWKNYSGYIRSVVIGDGVTGIGKFVFSKCSVLEEITIPKGVTYIGEGAFSDCPALKKVNYDAESADVSNPVYMYDRDPFDEDDNVFAVYSAFARSGDSETGFHIVFGNSVKKIPEYLITGCKNVTKITIGKSLQNFEYRATQGCSGLKEVEVDADNPNFAARNGMLLSKDMTTLVRCLSTQSGHVVIPDSVKTIDGGAFSGCKGLTTVTIPESVSSIGSRAFYGCENVTEIYYNARNVEDKQSNSGVFSQVGKKVDGGSCLIIGAGVQRIPAYLFAKESHMDFDSEVGLEWEHKAFPHISAVKILSQTCSIGTAAFYGCDELTSVSFSQGLTKIESDAFLDCKRLTAVSIPSSVTSIDDHAFAGCTALTSLTIPEGVSQIGGSAFSGCSKLTKVSVPGSVTSIGIYAFGECTALTSLTISEGVSKIGDSAFSGCSKLTKVSIPSSVTSMTGAAFAHCSGLTAIEINNKNPDFINKGKMVFSKDLKTLVWFPSQETGSVHIPVGVTAIGNGAFTDCSGLTEVVIPEGVASIGDDAFYGCTKLTEVTFPKSVTSIGGGAFYGCSGLTEVTIPEKVTHIGGDAFANCTGLTLINYNAKSADMAGNSAFGSNTRYEANDIKLVIGEGVLQIPSQVFSGYIFGDDTTDYDDVEPDYIYVVPQITSVMIPTSVTEIGEWAFEFSELKTVYYSGTKEQWEKISGHDTSYLRDAEKNYDHSHKYTDEVVSPTCTEKGYTKHTCVCGYAVCDTYVPVKHTYKNGVCTRCGAKNPNNKPAAPAVKPDYLLSTGKPYLKWKAVDGAVKYYVYRSGSKDGTYILLGTTTNLNYTDSKANAGYIYYYKVKAVNASGVKSSYSMAVTALCHCARPALNGAQYLASTGKPYLSWGAVTGAGKYYVYRAGSQNGAYKYIGSTTKTNYTDTTASAGYTYYYKVEAVSKVRSAANSANSKALAVNSHCARPVVKPDYLASTGKPYLKWSAVTGASKYEVYRAGSQNGTYKYIGSTTKTNYTDTTASAGYAYYYKVKAVSKVKAAANSAYSTVVKATCHCAKPVVKIALTQKGDPKLTWNTVAGAGKYEVYRATSKNGTYTKMFTTTNRSYTNTNARAGTTYYYKVKAISRVRSTANSSFSAIKSIRAR